MYLFYFQIPSNVTLKTKHVRTSMNFTTPCKSVESRAKRQLRERLISHRVYRALFIHLLLSPVPIIFVAPCQKIITNVFTASSLFPI